MRTTPWRSDDAILCEIIAIAAVDAAKLCDTNLWWCIHAGKVAGGRVVDRCSCSVNEAYLLYQRRAKTHGDPRINDAISAREHSKCCSATSNIKISSRTQDGLWLRGLHGTDSSQIGAGLTV